MQTRVVIRFEDFDGIGVYSSSKCRFIHAKTNPTFHPDPYSDQMLRYRIDKWEDTMREWYFAFMDKQQALNWFYVDEWLVELDKCGIVVSEYTCLSDDVVLGSHQAIFRSHESKQTFNLLEYFDVKLDSCDFRDYY